MPDADSDDGELEVCEEPSQEGHTLERCRGNDYPIVRYSSHAGYTHLEMASSQAVFPHRFDGLELTRHIVESQNACLADI